MSARRPAIKILPRPSPADDGYEPGSARAPNPIPAGTFGTRSRGRHRVTPVPAPPVSAHWHRTKDLIGLPGMPRVARPINHHGPRRGWAWRLVDGHSQAREWREDTLPASTQSALRARRGEADGAGVSPPCAGTEGEGVGVQAHSSPSIVCEGGGAALADARADIVCAFERWHRSQGGPRDAGLREWTRLYTAGGGDVLPETRTAVPAVAWNTLRRWLWASRDGGAPALVAGRGGRRSGIDEDPEIRATVEALVRANPRHVTAPHIRRVVAADHPDRETPSIHAIRRWVRAWRAEHAWELSATADPDGHRSRRQPAFGDGAAGAAGLNALWELDSTRLDVMSADGKRHTLVAAIDVWSRRAGALVAPTSRATSVAALMRRCLLDWGVPAEVRTDEGADYTSRHLRGALAGLGVTHLVLPPYSPEKKPFIERFIGTMTRDLLAHLPGFTGHDVADREALRSRESFAERRGKKRTVTFRCDLDAEALQQRIDQWCTAEYAHKPHAGLGGETPFTRAASWTEPRRRIDDERALDVLLAEPVGGGGKRTVGKKGLAVDGGIYIAAELGPLVGERVEVRRDPANWGQVWVFDLDGRFIAVAEDPLRTGMDREAVAIEAKRQAREKAATARRRAADLARTHEPDAAMDRVLAAAIAKTESVVAFPAPAAPHETPALAAARDAADAVEAAGTPQDVAVGENATVDLFRKFYLGGESDD